MMMMRGCKKEVKKHRQTHKRVRKKQIEQQLTNDKSD